jgi:hypothetical protein
LARLLAYYFSCGSILLKKVEIQSSDLNEFGIIILQLMGWKGIFEGWYWDEERPNQQDSQPAC